MYSRKETHRAAAFLPFRVFEVDDELDVGLSLGKSFCWSFSNSSSSMSGGGGALLRFARFFGGGPSASIASSSSSAAAFPRLFFPFPFSGSAYLDARPSKKLSMFFRFFLDDTVAVTSAVDDCFKLFRSAKSAGVRI